MRVGIIDYGVGNLGSIARALEELRVDAFMIEQASDMENADRLILPGVGNFTECMERLADGNWIGALKAAVLDKGKHLLGVCVGMQLLADYGTEGADPSEPEGTKGLGLIGGKVAHLRDIGCEMRVPHVGWNGIVMPSAKPDLFAGIPEATDFYFVHSYAFVANDPASVAATALYGVPFAAAVASGRVCGTQFHPEKSSRAGFTVLRNFTKLPAC